MREQCNPYAYGKKKMMAYFGQLSRLAMNSCFPPIALPSYVYKNYNEEQKKDFFTGMQDALNSLENEQLTKKNSYQRKQRNAAIILYLKDQFEDFSRDTFKLAAAETNQEKSLKEESATDERAIVELQKISSRKRKQPEPSEKSTLPETTNVRNVRKKTLTEDALHFLYFTKQLAKHVSKQKNAWDVSQPANQFKVN